jgi:hypothetical protein
MISKHWFSLGAVALVAGLTMGLTQPTVDGVSEGDSVSFSFRSPVVNGMGMKSLSDLRGKPVLVEFWGTR